MRTFQHYHGSLNTFLNEISSFHRILLEGARATRGRSLFENQHHFTKVSRILPLSSSKLLPKSNHTYVPSKRGCIVKHFEKSRMSWYTSSLATSSNCAQPAAALRDLSRRPKLRSWSSTYDERPPRRRASMGRFVKTLRFFSCTRPKRPLQPFLV